MDGATESQSCPSSKVELSKCSRNLTWMKEWSGRKKTQVLDKAFGHDTSSQLLTNINRMQKAGESVPAYAHDLLQRLDKAGITDKRHMSQMFYFWFTSWNQTESHPHGFQWLHDTGKECFYCAIISTSKWIRQHQRSDAILNTYTLWQCPTAIYTFIPAFICVTAARGTTSGFSVNREVSRDDVQIQIINHDVISSPYKEELHFK